MLQNKRRMSKSFEKVLALFKWFSFRKKIICIKCTRVTSSIKEAVIFKGHPYVEQ